MDDKKIIWNLIAVVAVIVALGIMQQRMMKGPAVSKRLANACYDAFYPVGYEVAVYDKAKRIDLEGSQSKAYSREFVGIWNEYSEGITDINKGLCGERAIAGFTQGCADAFSVEGAILTGAAIEGLTMLGTRPQAMIAGGVYYEGDSICAGKIQNIDISEGRIKVAFRKEEVEYFVGDTIRNPDIRSVTEKKRKKLALGYITPAMVDILKRSKPHSAPQAGNGSRVSPGGALEGENENFINALSSFRDAVGYNRKEDWETAIRDAQTALERGRLTPQERETLSGNIRECRDRISQLDKREKYDYHYGLAREALERSEEFEEDAGEIKEKSKQKALYKKAFEYCEKALGSYEEARKCAPTAEYKASCEREISSTERKIASLKKSKDISIY